jgi:polysaccharide deacetylase family protein (PEP-CTERM system associated)
MNTANAFTVDLEDWFQGLTSTNVQPERWDHFEARLEQSTRGLLALLDGHGVRATFFVLGHVARQYPDLIRAIDAAGHEIGVHGYWHRMVQRLSPQEFATELEQAIEELAPLIRQPLLGHRAPYFSINGQSLWALEILEAKGFHYDSSFFPVRSLLYGYPGAQRFPHRLGSDGGLVEFPIATARWAGVNWPIGGGFYVRSWPYWVIRRGLRQINRQGQPAVMYVHPWELDTGQHYTQVTPRERITHYHGRGGLRAKLERLFAEFDFVPLRDVLDRTGN